MESILNIQEKYHVDDSIKSYEYNEYHPTSGSDLNMTGEITFRINNEDEFYHPRRSYLLIEGDILKAANDNRYADADMISLTNNGILYLFSNIKYILGDQEIESLYHPGVASTMFGMVKHPFDYSKGAGLMQCWYPDTSAAADDDNLGFKARHDFIIEGPDTNGSFRLAVKLEDIFGFCEDYDKVVYGIQHSLKMVRTNDNDAIFRAHAADAGKIKLSKMTWMMPRVHANDTRKFDLYKIIKSKDVLDVAFRQRQCNTTELPAAALTHIWRIGVRTAPEKPRYIIIGIQQDKSGNQEANAALFDTCHVSKMSIVMNDSEYPALDANTKFYKKSIYTIF